MVTVGSIVSGTFRFVGDNLRSILIWSGLLILLSMATMALMQPFYAQQLAQAQSGTAVVPNFGQFGLFFLLFLVIFLVQFAAVFRAVLFPEQSRFAYLRLGMDELRLLGTTLVLGVGGGLVITICAALLGVVVGVLSVAAGAATGALLMGLLGLVTACVAIFFWVRLSLAGPLTILQKKVVIGPAWRTSRGNFWRLFGAYFVIGLLLFIVYTVVAFVQMGPVMTDMLHPTDPAAHERVLAWQTANYGLSARGLIYAVIYGILYGFSTALQGGMVAVATAQLLDVRGGQHLGEVFE